MRIALRKAARQVSDMRLTLIDVVRHWRHSALRKMSVVEGWCRTKAQPEKNANYSESHGRNLLFSVSHAHSYGAKQ